MNEIQKMNKEKIQKLESGFYGAINEDGKRVYVRRQKGEGWSISTPTHDRWREVAMYDEDGEYEGVTYERDSKVGKDIFEGLSEVCKRALSDRREWYNSQFADPVVERRCCASYCEGLADAGVIDYDDVTTLVDYVCKEENK